MSYPIQTDSKYYDDPRIAQLEVEMACLGSGTIRRSNGLTIFQQGYRELPGLSEKIWLARKYGSRWDTLVSSQPSLDRAGEVLAQLEVDQNDAFPIDGATVDVDGGLEAGAHDSLPCRFIQAMAETVGDGFDLHCT